MPFTYSVLNDVSYGPQPQHLMDVYKPDDVENAPVVLFIPGGGWAAADKARWETEAEYVASTYGWIAASATYRVALPSLPTALDDVNTLVDYWETDAALFLYGHDAARIAAWGESAGAQLAAMLGIQQRVIAVVNSAGPMDLVAFDGLGPTYMDSIFGFSVAANPGAYAAMSPTWWLAGGTTTTASFCNTYTTRDPIVNLEEQLVPFLYYAKQAGVKTYTKIEGGDRGGSHGLQTLMVPSAQFLDSAFRNR